MDLTNPKHLAELLKSHGFHTQKHLGQNFLIHRPTLEDIVEAAKIQETDSVLEIGPGPGVLTVELVKSPAQKVTVLELDEKVIPILEKTTGNPEKLSIIHTNALEYQPTEKDYILAANIPYYLTSPILRHFLGHINRPKRAIFLVQKEVAEKICAKPDDQSILSLQVGLYGKASIVKIVEKEKFFPAPEVDSAIIRVEMHESPRIPEEQIKSFWKIAKTAFVQRRKKIGNTLGNLKTKDGRSLKEVFSEIGVDANLRPQTLSFEDWKKICDYFV